MEVRRVLMGAEREVALVIRGARFEEEGGPADACASPLSALVRMHRRATALEAKGYVEDVARSSGVITLEPALAIEPIGLPLSRAALELRLGVALEKGRARALAVAAPLLLLRWPVGFRFAALFEAFPRDRGAHEAVAREIARLEPADVAAGAELLRVAKEQRNVEALVPALGLLPASRSFDTWMDVLELADDVGDRRHVPLLRSLARARMPADVREPLSQITRELGRRR